MRFTKFRQVAALWMKPRRPRLACASCGKTPAEDAAVRLVRVNVQGLPGVFLCQWCRPRGR
jgi:hypothetical protein